MYALSMISMALSASLAAAQSAGAATTTGPRLGYFTGMTVVQEPNGPTDQLKDINANALHFWWNKTMSAECGASASPSGDCCAPNDRTSFRIAADEADGANGSTAPSGLFLNTLDYGRGVCQQVYCSTASGELAFLPRGEILPTGNTTFADFSYTPESSRGGFGGLDVDGGFAACLAPGASGAYQIYCAKWTPSSMNCQSVGILTHPDFAGVAAGEYN